MSPSPPVLFVRPRKGSGGHTVTPYAIENQGSGVYRIMVYDSNHPNSSKYVEIDTNNDTWNYPALGWSGEAISHTLGLVPLNLYAQDPECPWDQESSGIQSNGSPTGQVWLTGPGHLLITDAQGRRIGYVGNQFVDEVPGAYGGVIDGGLGVETEPIYILPLTDTYTIMLDGQTLQQTGTAAVMQFGPGYAVGAENVTLGPTSQDLLTIAPDGTQVSLQASSDKEATLVLAIDETDLSHEFQVSGVDLGTGQSMTWRADLPSGSLVLDNSQNKGGEYDLEITWVDTTDEYEFAHNDIAIAAGDTHYFDYGNLDGGNLTLEIDEGSDGSIDETRELPNINLSQVLFDEAHEEQNTIDWARAQEIVPDHPEWVYFGQLSRTLAGEFTLERNPDAPLTHQLLQDYDALILAAPQSEFTSGEIRAIRQFVSNGGGLIVLGSCGLDHPANALLSDYEISFDPHCIWAPIPDLEGDFPVTNFASHPAVADVSSFTTNWAQSLLFGSGATYLAWTGTDAWQDTNWNDTCDPGDDPTGPFTIVAGYDTGYGRVAAVSDDSFQDDGFEWRGNVTLMRALLRWVTGGQEREFMFVYVPLVLREHR